MYLSSLKLGPHWKQTSLQTCYFSLLCINFITNTCQNPSTLYALATLYIVTRRMVEELLVPIICAGLATNGTMMHLSWYTFHAHT